MAAKGLSRRTVVGILGTGAAAASWMVRARGDGERRHLPPRDVSALFAPLAPGALLGRWTIAAIHPLEDGAVTVAVRGEGNHAFHLEVLARDESAGARPPAETERLAVYVRNGGDGWLPTVEDQGLAAMALARVLAANESDFDTTGLLTHAERLTAHNRRLFSEES